MKREWYIRQTFSSACFYFCLSFMQIYAKLDIVLVHVLELSPALKLHFT